MRFLERFKSRIEIVALSVAAVSAGALACAVCVGACVAPPANPPEVPLQRPTILQGSVFPPADQLLTSWPADWTFIVPIQLINQNTPFATRWYVDQDLVGQSSSVLDDGGIYAEDAGIYLATFMIPPPDPTTCHNITFLVADAFSQSTSYVADDLGSDQANWFYVPNGLTGCYEYDAGNSDVGASDGPSDALPVVPDRASF